MLENKQSESLFTCLAGCNSAVDPLVHVALPEQFFFNDTATTEIYTSIDTPSLHDALPISARRHLAEEQLLGDASAHQNRQLRRSEEHTSELQSPIDISYAVFCLKKKK